MLDCFISFHSVLYFTIVSRRFFSLVGRVGTLSKDDDEDGSENVAKKMNLRSFKLNRVYLDPLNMSNAGDLSWS